MAVRNVYTPQEKQMLAEWRASADQLIGWIGDEVTEKYNYPVYHRVATKELITHMACAADYANPLWRDENYARRTRWGGIIAPPMFQHCISHRGGIMCTPKVSPELGTSDTSFRGDYWEFFKPVKVGDSFKVWVARPKIEDITLDVPDAVRTFRVTQEVSYINQKDEITATVYEHRYTSIMPPGFKRPQLKFTDEFIYTKEDIAAIDRIAEAEIIRGAVPRYWEDVKIGEELQPVTIGPLTVWDQVVEAQGYGIAMLATREVRRQTPLRIAVDPVTNIPHKSIEFHLSEKTARMLGSYSTTANYPTIEHLFSRLVTNWMGDDGFLRKMNCLKLGNTPLGDTMFARGKVINKYVNDQGEYLVEIEIYEETVRGYIPNAAVATARLLSKVEIYK